MYFFRLKQHGYLKIPFRYAYGKRMGSRHVERPIGMNYIATNIYATSHGKSEDIDNDEVKEPIPDEESVTRLSEEKAATQSTSPTITISVDA